VFVGDRTRTRFVNENLYRDGEGFFPLPLKAPAELLVDRLERAPDITVENHPVFQDFLDQRNTLLASVKVQQYYTVPDTWKPKPDSGVRIIARLRNGAPLAVERTMGKGRVVAFLTSAAPLWNNWARWPSFVAVIHRLQAYLVGAGGIESHQVGSPLEVAFDASQYRPTVTFVPPRQAAKDLTPKTVDAPAAAGNERTVIYDDAEVAGIYEAQLAKTLGSVETRLLAVNVDAGEGDLETISGADLAVKLEPAKYQFEQAREFEYKQGERGGYNMGERLLYFLVLLLIGEQVLAWSASYHPGGRRAAAGGVS
jgi:hypothetical protein